MTTKKGPVQTLLAIFRDGIKNNKLVFTVDELRQLTGFTRHQITQPCSEINRRYLTVTKVEHKAVITHYQLQPETSVSNVAYILRKAATPVQGWRQVRNTPSQAKHIPAFMAVPKSVRINPQAANGIPCCELTPAA